MQADAAAGVRRVWIRGQELRQRWANMPVSSFYYRLSRGLIPQPSYPFGPNTPYWSLDAIEAFERNASEGAV